jgi:hypothetical protein
LANATSKTKKQASPPAGGEIRRNGRTMARARLRGSVIAELERAGFLYSDGLLKLPEATDPKDLVRRLHALHRENVLAKNASFLDTWEDRLIEDFAAGGEVVPAAIDPQIEVVDSERERALFRFATLHWSVPVSQGYGRRSRFLIRDGATGKLIGVFALGDPVFNLGVRDRLIGWGPDDRQERLYNVFDAYVLGAVDPYRRLIGGKLAALCALSDETADFLVQKYHGTTTEIRGEQKSADPVLITTTSSLGRSAIYSRLKYRDRWAYRSIGFTGGFGHFHFSDELFERLLEFLRDEGHDVRGHKYGEGPNWRIRTLRKALDALGLDGDLLRHGIKREVFVAPRAMGWRAYLRGESTHLHWIEYPLEDLAEFWRTRWGAPRAERDPSYTRVDRDSMRLTPQLEAQPRG